MIMCIASLILRPRPAFYRFQFLFTCVESLGTRLVNCYVLHVTVFVLSGLILPAVLVSTGVLIIIIALLCVVICVMYKLRRNATPV